MGSTFRDRTAEFHSLSQTLKKIGAAIPSVLQAESDPTSSKRSSPPGSSRSEFNKKASQIGLRIHETSQKTARLSKCLVFCKPTRLPPVNSGAPSGSQLRRRSAIENAPSQQMEMSMLQQTVPRQESYSQNRAVALHSVESTITELSGIFTHLATMVTQQGELAIRIDDNMDESLVNVEGARSALLQHLTRISSNRWLMIKIFAVIILFLIVFLFFVA
ncbi:hypothetical protein F2Q70_00007138 [Brassica cretica]|uniref:t-SNARE coiled-coil homology domain-containing protein n=1 Tax=Brassica cretica TaxID=69181 RepID=A0A8S9M398_BRACR|nr:hypothetical protein F2Q70_00007138 [Brassica cretica]